MKIWKDEEVKSLFAEVEKCKKENRALREAFASHAQKFGRKANSVRNYYYADVENLSKDEERAKRLAVTLSQHEKKHFTAFDKEQEEDLFEKIKSFVENGMSVRSACLKLSGGNLTEMTRIQNKYQNMLKKLERNNIVQFKQKSIMTDGEINSLFLGLVKLVKKVANEQAEEKSKLLESEIEHMESELLQLRHENVLLKKENETIRSRLIDRQKALEKKLSASQVQKTESSSKRV